MKIFVCLLTWLNMNLSNGKKQIFEKVPSGHINTLQNSWSSCDLMLYNLFAKMQRNWIGEFPRLHWRSEIFPILVLGRKAHITKGTMSQVLFLWEAAVFMHSNPMPCPVSGWQLPPGRAPDWMLKTECFTAHWTQSTEPQHPAVQSSLGLTYSDFLSNCTFSLKIPKFS